MYRVFNADLEYIKVSDADTVDIYTMLENKPLSVSKNHVK